jgi:hypothetical protein
MEKIEYYQNLYKQYKELLNKTTLRANNIGSSGKIEIQNIFPKDLEEKLKIQKELLQGLNFLTDNQLIDLSGDDDFSEETKKVINKRNLIQ